MLELRVMTAAQEYVYTGDDGLLSATEAEVIDAVEDGEVTLGDVTLGLAAPFLGANGRGALPAVSIAPRVASGAAGGGYRAVLRQDGVDRIDGVIPRADLRYDREPRAWSAPLVSGSADDLWARLEKVRLGDMLQGTVDSLTSYDLARVVRDESGGGVRYAQAGTIRWYTVASVLGAVITEASRHGVGASTVTLEEALPVLQYAVRYRVHGEDEDREIVRSVSPLVCSTALYNGSTYSRTSLSLPDWSGREFAEAVLTAFGWRFAVRYDSYPSTDLLVRVLPDAWQERTVAGLNSLDERVAQGGVTEGLSRAGEARSFAIQMAGVPRPSSPLDLRPPIVSGSLSGIMERIPAPPPPEAQIAPDRWSFEPAPRQVEPVSTMERVESVKFVLPSIVVTHNDVVGGGIEHPLYEETERTGIPFVDDGATYLGSRTFRGGRLFYRLDPTTPAADQAPMVHPVWASALYRMRDLSRQPLEAISGDFYAHGIDVRAGRDVAFDALHWQVRERRQRLSDDLTTLEIVRPAGVAPPSPDRPTATEAVRGLSGTKYRVNNTNGQLVGGFAIVTWQPPAIEKADVMRYDVQVLSKSTGEWYVPAGVEPYATAVAIQFNLGAVLESDAVRVRAVGRGGSGPWTQIEVPGA